MISQTPALRMLNMQTKRYLLDNSQDEATLKCTVKSFLTYAAWQILLLVKLRRMTLTARVADTRG
jgi:hypothetical protein